MKTKICLLVLLFFYLNLSAQWQQEWNSPSISSLLYSGWIAFSEDGEDWDYKYYLIDEASMKIMNSYYSSTVLYQYNFTDAEIFGGYQIYSLGVDLTGDGNVEFYVLSYYGSAEPYRQSFKIFDITNGQILLEKNNSAFYYSYPVVWDADGEGILECTFAVWDYPNFINYNYEVYNTGVSTSVLSDGEVALSFDLKQNYPNPFNPSTTIEFGIQKMQHVSLNVFDALGRKISTIVNKSFQPGRYKVEFMGDNLSSGNYFYQLKTDNGVKTKKMSLIK